MRALGWSRGAVKNQIGFSTYYRIKRVSYNTFRDIRFYGHFFDESPDLRIRTKSSIDMILTLDYTTSPLMYTISLGKI